jgi:hypothetical protein
MPTETQQTAYPPAVFAEIERGREKIAEYAQAEADLFARRREAFRRLVVGLLDDMPPEVGAWLYARLLLLEVSTAVNPCRVIFSGFPRELVLCADFVGDEPWFHFRDTWHVRDWRFIDRWFGPRNWAAAFAAAAERVE